jgi:hypothetical protein
MPRALFGPSPNTVCVAFLYKSQPVHRAAASRSAPTVGSTGIKSRESLGGSDTDNASGRGVHPVNAAQQGCIRAELPFFSTAKAAYPQSCAHGKVPIRRPSTEI